VTKPDLVRTSKFLSLVLRHRPQRIGLQLDPNGWADVDELIERAVSAGIPLDRALLKQVVEQNDKQRFALSDDGTRIRANQGHSIPIELDLPAVAPPEDLFHGTAAQFLPSIERQGLLRGRRQHVHLSPDESTAVAVGRRHGTPVVLHIRSGAMHRAGLLFYRSENNVWLTPHVPVDYIELPR
jgi:putative RNA 2'-phosphotransferase